MRIFNLTKKTGNLSSNDFFGVDNGSTVNKIDYNALAKTIIEQYTGSSLAGSAQSVKAALDALNSKWHKNINADQDLNNLTDIGLYDCQTGAIAQTLSNCPASSNFVMQVYLKGSYHTQLIIDGTNIYIRSQISSGWQRWYKLTGTGV